MRTSRPARKRSEPVSSNRSKQPARMIGIREFRATFHTLKEPVIVINSKGLKPVGTWTPAPTEDKDGAVHDR